MSAILSRFIKKPFQVVVTDPVLAYIFNKILDNGGTAADALSAIITIVSGTNFYGQQPAFNKKVEVTES
ncbi:hypothetical protein FKW77_003881 [Venturia effusa]|uniref:Uncharacterized protein n=1 Tax=Venturia effusa TaxID=50376 RepID=A0A517LDL2_9PEZI|nr:hypothetical protein FKW77_003881 [Venturia effusa]